MRAASALGRREAALLALLYWPAMRVSEAVGVTWGGCDWDRQRIRWWRPKLGDWHELGLHPRLGSQLEGLRRTVPELRPDGRVLVGQRGPVTRSWAYRAVRDAGLDAGIERSKAHPHTLRHSRLTHLVEADAPLAVVQRIAGHADVSTTSAYLHVADGIVSEWARSP
jgi:integrase